MKSILLLLSTLSFCEYSLSLKIFHHGRESDGFLGAPNYIGEVNVPEKWFEQSADHFFVEEVDFWKQRYFTNSEFHKPGGPVFLMVSEGAANPVWMKTGAWIEYGKRFGALLIMLEQRFYGKSHPSKDLSVKNTLFLASEQAVFDIAYFISNAPKDLNLEGNEKWIVFGGSFAGSIAAWSRLKYPHLIHGAVASSAPLLAKTNFEEYYSVVAQSLEANGKPCVTAISEATSELETLIADPTKVQSATALLRLCDDIDADNKKDLSNLFESLASNVAGVVLNNNVNRRYKTEGSSITIDHACSILTNESIGSSLHRYAALNSLILDAHDRKCLDYKYSKMVEELKHINWEDDVVKTGARQWALETCKEFGFFQTSDHKPQVFGKNFPEEFFVQECIDIFGDDYDKEYMNRAIDVWSMAYGDLNIEVSNVAFVQGSLDPWHSLGITKNRPQESQAIYIEGAAHCADMYPQLDSDPEPLKTARKQIADLIANWLSD